MDEVYTCTCGGQTWIISDGSIVCDRCGKEYTLRRFKRLSGIEAYVLDRPRDFHNKIRPEEKPKEEKDARSL